jgi:type III pantothenate kinase
MRLLVDAGNTRIKWAVVADADRSTLPRWQQQGAVERAQVEALAQDWSGLASQAAADEALQVCVSNVAGPALRESLQALFHDVFGPRVIVEWFASTAERAGVRNGYRHPGQLGCDRFAAAIAARALFPDQELLVATCGTATTIDVVSADGCFEGGMILPGFGTMATSLALNTAQLPRIDGAAPPNGCLRTIPSMPSSPAASRPRSAPSSMPWPNGGACVRTLNCAACWPEVPGCCWRPTSQRARRRWKKWIIWCS